MYGNASKIALKATCAQVAFRAIFEAFPYIVL